MKTTTRNITLVSTAFRSLSTLIAKSIQDCASFDPTLNEASDLRSKYKNLYDRCIELFSKESRSKEDKDEESLLSYGIVIDKYDLIKGFISISFYRTVGTVEKKYVLNVWNEHGEFVKAAQRVRPTEVNRVANSFSMV